MASVEQVNGVSITEAKTSYVLMNKILGDNEAPLIFASLPISTAAITGGLVAYETTLINAQLAYERIGLELPKN